MNRRTAIRRLATFFLTTASLAHAQPLKQLPQIGYLAVGNEDAPTVKTVVAEFKQGLRDLGWIDGKQVRFELRYARRQLDKLSELAAELVHLKVNVIVTAPGTEPALAAKQATATIPIVMVAVVDPVGEGFAASLARPGGNITGFSFDVTPEQAGKYLEILKEAAPKVSRVAILRNPDISSHLGYSKEAERAATKVGVGLHFVDVQSDNSKGLEDALGAAVKGRANALLIIPSASFAVIHRQRIINFAARYKLPAIYPGDVFVDNGGLMSYGPNYQDLHRRATVYVDKILRGTKPDDLPIQQPTKFDFVINLKTAKQIGITIPQWTLMKATKVIQ